MSKNQINFYMMPEDMLDIDNYLKQKGLLVIAEPMPTDKLWIIPSIEVTEYNGCKISKKFIIQNHNYESISLRYSNLQNNYRINETLSPVIEFLRGKIEDNQFFRGRLYYVKEYYSENNEIIYKNSEFLDMANALFQWIKKHFKNVKQPGFENFLVTERTKEWLHKSNGKLLLNNVKPSTKANPTTGH